MKAGFVSFRIVLSIFLLTTVFGCTKELDLASGSCFDVKQFLKSKNCKTKCGEPAQSEGKRVCLRGNIVDLSMISYNCSFQLTDLSSDKYYITIAVDSSICTDVHNFLLSHQQDVIHVLGTVRGYDMPMNFTCERGFSIDLTDLADISTE